MLLASWGMNACPSHKHRELSSNPAVSGPIPEQLSALSLLTYLYSPSFAPKQQPMQGLRGAKEAWSALPHQPPASEGRWGLWLGASALHLVLERQWCAGTWVA